MGHLKTWCAAAGLSAVTALAPAAPLPLQGRDINGGPVAPTDPSAVFEYDPNLNITWLRDWNYGRTTTGWIQAWVWSTLLVVGPFSGWALPTIDAGDTNCSASFNPGEGYPIQHYGYNCKGSPMGYLYYTEGITPSNPGPFLNMQPFAYWSDTYYVPNLDPFSSLAWYFRTYDGYQTFGDSELNQLYAVAARPGDVLVVPELQADAMMLLGLSTVIVAVRRRRLR